MQLLAVTDAGTGVRGHVGVWGPTVWGAGSGGERRDTQEHAHTERNLHTNVALTL